jgi:hypothetical protein
LVVLAAVLMGAETPSVAAFQGTAAAQGRLIVFGDVALFLGKPGTPGNCATLHPARARQSVHSYYQHPPKG